MSWNETLHPRGFGGKFGNGTGSHLSVGGKVAAKVNGYKGYHSTGLTEADRVRARKATAGFSSRKFPNDKAALEYLQANAPKGHAEHRDAVNRYTGDTFFELNKKLRAGDATDPEVKRIDAAMTPTKDDLMVTRHVGADAFGLTDKELSQVEHLAGKKLTDKAYTSTAIGSTYGGGLGGVTLRIAVPKGSPAVNVAGISNNPHERELLLPRNQELAITKVERNKSFGWDVWAIALPKS